MLEKIRPGRAPGAGRREDLLSMPWPQDQGQFISYSLPWPATSLLSFLRQAANAPRIYWESQKSPLAFAGWGVAATLTASGPQRFQRMAQAVADLFQQMTLLNEDLPPLVGPRLFGGFAFEPEHTAQEIWSAFPAARFILPRYQLSRIGEQMWLTVNQQLDPAVDLAEAGQLLRREIQQLQTLLRAVQPENSRPATEAHPSQAQPETMDLIEQLAWQELVSQATRRIRRGELDKVVLARARLMQSPRPVEPVDVLSRLAQPYPDCYRFLLEPIPGHAFYGATPELLAELNGSTLQTVAMAGSIRRGQSPAEDAGLGQQLLNNPKERHEHALVVEAIEENLRPVVTDLQIPAEPGLCRLSNIQHLQTPIQAKLAQAGGILPVIAAMHPTPAVGGRPRPIALDLIKSMEPTPRGWYAGPVGWLDHRGNGLFAVAIRSAVSVGHETMLFAGAGIMAGSEPEKEWHETQLKFRPLQEALAGASR